MLFWSIVAGIYTLGKVILLLGILYEALAGAVERRRYPPPGRLVDVGGHRLHLWETGTGDGPTVVLESGAGNPGILWARVQQALARSARVVIYDRAGYGWSDGAKGPRTGPAVVQELHALLHQAGVPGPYILVGHSLGGMYARLYADLYRDEVAGMVLVDARHENISGQQPALLGWITYWMSPVAIYLAYLGILRLLVRWKPGLLTGGRDLIREYPRDLRESIRVKVAQPRLHRATWAEMRKLPDLEERLRQAGDLGDLPLTVLTAGRLDAAGLPRRQRDSFRRLWQESQVRLAALSTRSRHLVVKGCGHGIPMERPDVVVAAVEEMLRG